MISVYKDFDNPPKDLLGDQPKITTAVKQALYDLYHGKCAFSEEKMDFDQMEILHYRPVALYPELEFEWSNLLPVSKNIKEAISSDNKNKRNSYKFQLLGEKVYPELLKHPENRKADAPCLLAEQPLLLHPEVDTPENHFYYIDEKLASFSRRGTASIDFLNLNHDSLSRKRQFLIDNQLMSSIKELFSTVEKKYTASNDYNPNRNEISIDITIIPNYLNIIQPYWKELLSLFAPNQEFSYFTKCYIEKYLVGIQHTRSLGSNYPLGAKINADVKDIVSLSIAHFFSTKSYILNQDKTIHQLDFIDSNWQKALPCSLQSIQIRKFHSIKSLTVKSIPLNTRWIFLTGENGYGKTLILQSIVLTLSGNDQLTNDKTNITTWLYSNHLSRITFPRNINWQDLFETPQVSISGDSSELISSKNNFNKYAAYGANRLALSGYVDAYTQAPQKVNKTDSLFHNKGILYNIEEYLINLHNKPAFQQRKEAIIDILKKLLPSVGAIQIDDSAIKSKVWYQEKAEDGSLLAPIPFHSLSAGNKSIIAMIGDMIIELLESQKEASIYKLEGIVLIDEIDIHLHPKWQKQFVQTLTNLFPKIQFIASTHSPIPLLGAPRETIILNVEKPSKKEGIKIKRLDIDVSTLTPDTILSSPIFGFDGIISNAYDENEPLYTGETYNDVVFEQHLDKKLDEFAEKNEVDLDDLLNGKEHD